MLGMLAGADCKSLFGALSLFLMSVTKGAHVSNSHLGTYWCQTFEKQRNRDNRYFSSLTEASGTEIKGNII